MRKINEWKEKSRSATTSDDKRKIYYDYLKSSEWNNVRNLILERDEHKCIRCKSTYNLQAHHTTYQNIFNESKHLEDLVTLCFDCHKKEHPDKETTEGLVTGFDLRDAGIRRAIRSANSKNPEWSEMAFNCLKEYIKTHNEFMIEDVRMSSDKIISDPPSKRAWGAIAVRGAKLGIIRKKGYQNVINPKAHATPATLWEVV
jgi:5-methylcytosine-specific restriction endonuclease McrA